MNMTRELIEILKEFPDYEITVSGDIAHKLKEDDLGVRVFSESIADISVENHRKEITIVMEIANLNFSLVSLLKSSIDETIENVIDSNTNDKGQINTTKRLKQKLKKEILSSISERLKQ